MVMWSLSESEFMLWLCAEGNVRVIKPVFDISALSTSFHYIPAVVMGMQGHGLNMMGLSPPAFIPPSLSSRLVVRNIWKDLPFFYQSWELRDKRGREETTDPSMGNWEFPQSSDLLVQQL